MSVPGVPGRAHARVLKVPVFDRVGLIAIGATLVFSVACVFVSSIWPVSLAQCIFFLLALASIVRAVVQQRMPAVHWLLAPFAGIVIWGLLQILLGRSVNRFETWAITLRFAAYLSALFAGLQLFETSRVRATFRVAAIYFGCVLGAEAIIQRFTADGRIFWIVKSQYTSLAMGPFVNHDHYAALIELMFPLALWQSLVDRERALRFAVIAAVMFVSVTTAASRAGFILILAELVVVLALGRRGRKQARAAVPYRAMAATLALIAVFGSVVGWDLLLDRFKTGTSEEIRWQLWKACGRMAKDRPGMGFGLGCFETAYPAYAAFDAGARVDHAHNDWAEWTAEGGFPLLGLLLAIGGGSLWMAVRYPWGFGAVSLLLHSLVDFPLQEPAIFFCLLVLLAVLAREYSSGRDFTGSNETRTHKPVCN